MNHPLEFHSETAAALNAAFPQRLPMPVYTVRQFCTRNPAFTESAVRNLVFKAQPRHSSKGMIPGNGMIEAGAVTWLGRKVLIHEANFLAWVMQEGL